MFIDVPICHFKSVIPVVAYKFCLNEIAKQINCSVFIYLFM